MFMGKHPNLLVIYRVFFFSSIVYFLRKKKAKLTQANLKNK